MVCNVDGSVKQGLLVWVELEGKVMCMWEVIEIYMECKQLLIIVVGVDYGQGFLCDWVVKGVCLVGVEVIVVEGFECIYCINLIGMGVLLLEFKLGIICLILGIDGSEIFDVFGVCWLCVDLILVIYWCDGEWFEVLVICCLDSDEEVFIYEVGGVL